MTATEQTPNQTPGMNKDRLNFPKDMVLLLLISAPTALMGLTTTLMWFRRVRYLPNLPGAEFLAILGPAAAVAGIAGITIALSKIHAASRSQHPTSWQ